MGVQHAWVTRRGYCSIKRTIDPSASFQSQGQATNKTYTSQRKKDTLEAGPFVRLLRLGVNIISDFVRS
jgi:hypothetical protein